MYVSPNGTQLCGLADVGDNANEPLIATAEHTHGTPAKLRVLLLRRHAAESMRVVQSFDLSSTIKKFTSFAHWPGWNLFCAVLGSNSLHELCRSQGASTFDTIPRVHLLPEEVITICGLQTYGECRLAVSFGDKTLRVFRVAGATLCELQRLPRPDATFWEPRELLALPGGSLILRSRLADAANSETVIDAIECCAAQQDGSLARSNRLHVPDIELFLIGLLPTTDVWPTLCIAAFECSFYFSASILYSRCKD